MFTVTNKGRVMFVCDCCKLEFPGGDSIPEVRQRALEQGCRQLLLRALRNWHASKITEEGQIASNNGHCSPDGGAYDRLSDVFSRH
jgi:hypothetical protein